MLRGMIKEELVTYFIEKNEVNKIKFNEAITKEDRKNIILEVKNDWKEFINIVKENIRG